ncbi:activator-dependent family glycosyltransferase [Spirillospora sp. NBC_00431]
MKVLFASFAGITHFLPMVPMAWALRTAGHDVLVASQPDLTETIVEAGLTAAPVGRADWMNDDPWAEDLLGDILWPGAGYVQAFDFPGHEPERWTWESLLTLERIMVPALYASMNNDAMMEDLIDLARSWRPDLVLWETYTFSGAVAARVAGAAHARMILGPNVALRVRRAFLRELAAQPPDRREDPTREWLGWTLERFGRHFDEEIVTGQWTIDATPPSMRLDTGVHTLGTRFVPHTPGTVPHWLREPADRPRVCFTMGLTELSRVLGDSLGDCLRALAAVDGEVIMTLAEEDLAGVPEVPANVRLVGFVPLHEVLPTCSAVVHGAGAATRAAAQIHGVPQISIGSGWDTVVEAERLEELGAGVCLPLERLTEETLRESLLRVLNDPAFTKAAGELRQEVMSLPTPNETIPAIERLAAERRSTA